MVKKKRLTFDEARQQIDQEIQQEQEAIWWERELLDLPDAEAEKDWQKRYKLQTDELNQRLRERLLNAGFTDDELLPTGLPRAIEPDDPRLPQVNAAMEQYNRDWKAMKLKFGAKEGEPPALQSPVSNTPPSPIRYSEAEKDILDVLRTAGKRLTTTQIAAKLSGLGKEQSDGNLKNNLAALGRHALLTNDTKAEPRGYGLPEWS